MKTKTKAKDYSYGAISNMRDLRAARGRVEWEISFRERQLSGRLPSLKKMLSVGNIASLVARKAGDMQTLALTAINTYELIRSRFGKGGKAENDPSERDSDERTALGRDSAKKGGSGSRKIVCECEEKPRSARHASGGDR